MQKRMIDQPTGRDAGAEEAWLDVETLARVDLTSEHPAFPFESALHAGSGPGWRAHAPGVQTLRLQFATPQPIRRVRLVFEEATHARTQEFTLAYATAPGQHDREVVRQQYTFSPPTTTREVEEYTVALEPVTALELRIVPSISGGAVYASLREWRIA
jgi:hypothetical protein